MKAEQDVKEEPKQPETAAIPDKVEFDMSMLKNDDIDISQLDKQMEFMQTMMLQIQQKRQKQLQIEKELKEQEEREARLL